MKDEIRQNEPAKLDPLNAYDQVLHELARRSRARETQKMLQSAVAP
jgi:hypothetical protein